tara:strand:+ start:243 stop:1103 length:861 start_codon:yes stop_codon:yes gene_type:complete
MYLSIDFEDFNHDLKRSLGLWESGPLNKDFLWEKYNIINNIFKNSCTKEGRSGTFFCTGIIASKEPELIKKISSDGHEIACHYNYHDVMKGQSEYEIEKNLSEAKNALEEASGKSVYGFRAPMFSIDKNNPYQYKIVEKLFTYDSSFSCTTKDELKKFKRKMKLEKLKILPIFHKKISKLKFRLGGSYLKLFPYIYSKRMFQMSLKNGFIPHVYLHPYEFGASEQIRLSKDELIPLGLVKAFYWSIRQNQWLKFRNESLKFKLRNLLLTNNLDGTLYDFSLSTKYI